MEDQDKLEASFATGPIAKTVLANAVPSMFAMLLALVYNLADTFFVGQTNDALQVAAVSLSMPVFMLFMTIGELFGIGGVSVISRALGRGECRCAESACALCFWGSAAAGIILSVVFLLGMEPLLSLIGASADTWELARSYLSVAALAGPFSAVSTTFANVLRAEGQPRKAVAGQAAGNVLNVLLDPLLILVLDMGVAGAAWATFAGNMLAACYYLLFYLRGASMLSISPRGLRGASGVVGSVLGIGAPAALGSLLMSVSQVVVNMQIAVYGDLPLAAIGVAMKVTMVTGMVSMGLGQGVQPILGFCTGARMTQRFKEVLRFSLLLALCFGAALTGACYLLCEQICAAFLTDAEALEYAVRFARILLSTGFLFGVFYVMVNALQGMGAERASLLVNVSRQGSCTYLRPSS